MELLTILNPGIIGDWEPTSRRTDNSGLTPALVDAAMAGANPIGIMLLKMRVCGNTGRDRGRKRIEVIVKQEAIDRNWKLSDKKLIRLTDLCVWEYVNPAKCRICHGSGKVSENNVILANECPLCEGSGEGRHVNTHRAEFLGVSRTSYYKIYDKKRAHLDDLLNQILPDYEHAAVRHIKRLLSG